MARKNFKNLVGSLPAKRRARIEHRTNEMLIDMLPAEIRRNMGVTQKKLAEKIGITQPALSKLENQDDMQISTLRRFVNALGGQLEIIAHFPQKPRRNTATRLKIHAK